MNKRIIIGIAWYRKEQWELLKSTAVDSEIIENTYEEWEKKANKILIKLKKQGFHVEKVDFDVEKFNEWCKKCGKKPDTRSRTEYVIKLLQEKNNQKNSNKPLQQRDNTDRC